MTLFDNMVKPMELFLEYFKGHWKSSEPPMPTYATLVYWLFWAEGTWETADAGRALCPPPFYLKAGHEISPEKSALPIPGRERSYHQRLGIDAEMDLYKHTS